VVVRLGFHFARESLLFPLFPAYRFSGFMPLLDRLIDDEKKKFRLFSVLVLLIPPLV
jgi:hypothetical protein